MTITDLYVRQFESLVQPDANPYLNSPYSEQILDLTTQLVREAQPFMSSDTFPDMREGNTEFAVYVFSGNDPFAAIPKSIDGLVMGQVWNKKPEDLYTESLKIKDNSYYFVVVDVSDPLFPKPAVSLSISDPLKGPSETIETFKTEFPDQEIPTALTVTETDREQGLFDVMDVVRLKEYKYSSAVAWAYSALNQASKLYGVDFSLNDNQDCSLKPNGGVDRWIANMTEEEFEMLQATGGVFERVENTTTYPLYRDGKDPIYFGFQTVDVARSSETVAAKIKELLRLGDDYSRVIANIASITLNGRLA